jgi:sulfonate transport system ATP-binding protein
MESSVRVSHLTKAFKSKRIVVALDLKPTAGEFLVLLGPSGCGKPTALRRLAELETPASGTIRFRDRSSSTVDAGSTSLRTSATSA